jgi:transcriptional regulator with XRE-family HTH domain
MGNIGERIRPIRDSLGMGRTEFGRLVGVGRKTIENIELGRQRATEDIITEICKQWPQFAYWLVTGNSRPEYGDISPEIEEVRRAKTR